MAVRNRKSTARPAPRPKSGRRRSASRRRRAGLVPWRAGLLILLLLISLSALAYLVFLHQPAVEADRQGQPDPPVTAEAAPSPPLPSSPASTFSPIPPPAPARLPAPAAATAPPAPDDQRPLVAIIIDDMGSRLETERQMLALDLELTFSFIPFSPHLNEALASARDRNREILLHLPLEAVNAKWNSTPGILLTSMSATEIAAGFAAALAEVPMAVGVNNHMGSRFTADPDAMDRLLKQLARYDLFFLDSLTTPDSAAREAADRQRVPFLRRSVFLDNDQDEEKIGRQLDTLLRIAEKHGKAVGIGHSYPATLQTLHNYRPELERRVRLVKLSHLYDSL